MTWLDLKKEENVIECLEKKIFTILFIHSGTLPSCLNLLFTILTQYSYLYIKQVIFIIAMRTYFYFILHLQEQTPCSTMLYVVKYKHNRNHNKIVWYGGMKIPFSLQTFLHSNIINKSTLLGGIHFIYIVIFPEHCTILYFAIIVLVQFSSRI